MKGRAMTTAIMHDPDQALLELQTAPLPRLLDRASTLQTLPELEPAETAVLALFDAAIEPLSCGQIARLAGLSLSDARSAARALCSLGLVRRLNTLVEGYVAGAPRVT
jgi:hypothetical protein